MSYIICFDGLFKSFPTSTGSTSKAGIMCYGWLIQRDEIVIARGYGGVARGANATSNIAEYLALIEALEAYLDAGLQNEPVTVTGDAKGVIDQMQGYSAVNASNLKPLFVRAKRLASQIQVIEWIWTPRQFNRAADLLTRRAMRQIRQGQKNSQKNNRGEGSAYATWSQSKKLLNLFDLRVYTTPISR